MVSLYSYSVFATVAEKSSFAKAAAILNLTPSAVSHSIAKLEDEFGFSLFVRGKKQLSLTIDGAYVLSIIRNILSSSALLDQKVAQIKGLTQGTIRLGAINSVTVNWLPDILGDFRLKFPAVNIQVTQSGYNKLISDIISNKLDIAFVSYSSIRNLDTALQFTPLHKDRLVCVSPRDFVPENKSFVTIDEIKSMNLIFHEDGDDVDVVAVLNKYNLRRKSDFSIFNDSSLIAMVKCGFGHSIMPELSLKGILTSDVTIYPIIPVEYRELGLVAANPKYLTPTAQEMIKYIQDYIGLNSL